MSIEVKPTCRVTVQNCQRCGETHDLEFQTLSNPADEFTWWALCPATREPLLMYVEEEGGDT